MYGFFRHFNYRRGYGDSDNSTLFLLNGKMIGGSGKEGYYDRYYDHCVEEDARRYSLRRKGMEEIPISQQK